MSASNTSRIDLVLSATQAIEQSRAVSTEIDNIGKTAQRAGVSGAAGLTQLERQIAQNRVVIAQLNTAIAESAAVNGRDSDATRALRAEQTQLALVTRELVAQKGLLAVETKQEAAANQQAAVAAKETAVANDQLAVSNVAVADTAGLSARQMIVAGGAASRLAGAAIPGARAISVLTGAFSAASLGTLAVIVGVSILIGWLIKLGKAKEDVIKIDEKQVALDAVSAQLGGNQLRVQADIIQSIRSIASEREKYAENTRNLTRDLGLLDKEEVIHAKTIEEAGRAYAKLATPVKDLQEGTAIYNKNLADQDKSMKPAIDSLRVLGQAYGLNTDALIKAGERYHAFGTEQKEVIANQKFFRDQLNADLPALEALAAELTKDTNRMVDLERAALAAAFAILQIKPPKLNLGGFQTPGDANDRLRQAAATAVIAADKLGQSLSDDQIFNAIRPELEGVRKGFLDTAAALGKNQAETKALFNSYVSQLDPMYQQWIARLATVAKNEQVFTDEKKAGAAAAREAMRDENILFQLRKENFAADEKLGKLNFEKQRELIHEEFEDRRKVEHDKAVSRHASVADTKTINDELIWLERKMILLNQNEEAAYTIKLTEEYNKRLEHGRKFRAAEQKDFLAFMVKQRQDREKMQAEAIAAQDKLDRIARIDRPGRASAQAEQYRADAEAIDRVRTGFDQASRAGRAFDEMIRNIALDGAASFKGIGGAVAGLAQDLFSVANIANFVGNAIGNAFEAAISGADSFGHSLTKAVLGFIAGIAQQFGAMFILIGSGLIWLGYPGGGALIGYGIALEALAGVLRGVAGRIGNDNPQQSIAAAGGGGSATASATPRRDPTPKVIAFPTSGAASTGGDTIIQLDRQGTRDFLDGKGVLTVSSIRGKHNRTLKKAVA